MTVTKPTETLWLEIPNKNSKRDFHSPYLAREQANLALHVFVEWLTSQQQFQIPKRTNTSENPNGSSELKL